MFMLEANVFVLRNMPREVAYMGVDLTFIIHEMVIPCSLGFGRVTLVACAP